MSPADAMARIEAHAFAAMVNLASNFKTFLRILVAQPEVQALLAAAKGADGTIIADVLLRLLHLTGRPFDPRYEHPDDAAMAAYLVVLYLRSEDLADIGAAAVLQCQQCWWARRVAERIRSRFRSEAAYASTVVGTGSATVDYGARSQQWSNTTLYFSQIGPPAVGQEAVVRPLPPSRVTGLFHNYGTSDHVQNVPVREAV
jgi:hypothetical protein